MKTQAFMRSAVILIAAAVLSLLFSDCVRCSSPRSRAKGVSSTRDNSPRTRRSSGGQSVIKMRHENGVYYVPCEINGVEMEFIFDTGASDITISLTEAQFLYKQNKLSEKDIKGSEYYQIADGSVSEGTVINLKSVTIGNKTLYNVKASVVHNSDAPLLLGQSALSKFGKISIDYKHNEITLE